MYLAKKLRFFFAFGILFSNFFFGHVLECAEKSEKRLSAEEQICAAALAAFNNVRSAADPMEEIWLAITATDKELHGMNKDKPRFDRAADWSRKAIEVWSKVGVYFVLPQPKEDGIWNRLTVGQRRELASRIANLLAQTPINSFKVRKTEFNALEYYAMLAPYVLPGEQAWSEMLERAGRNEEVDSFEMQELINTLEERAVEAGERVDPKSGDYPFDFDYAHIDGRLLENRSVPYSTAQLFHYAVLGYSLPPGIARAYIMAGMLGALGAPPQTIIIEKLRNEYLKDPEHYSIGWLRLNIANSEPATFETFYPAGSLNTAILNIDEFPIRLRARIADGTISIESIAGNSAFVESDRAFLDLAAQKEEFKRRMAAASLSSDRSSVTIDMGGGLLGTAPAYMWFPEQVNAVVVLIEAFLEEGERWTDEAIRKREELRAMANQLRQEILDVPVDSFLSAKQRQRILKELENAVTQLGDS